MLDFKKAVWSALCQNLPDVQLKGCSFHWTKSLWRKVGSYVMLLNNHKLTCLGTQFRCWHLHPTPKICPHWKLLPHLYEEETQEQADTQKWHEMKAHRLSFERTIQRGLYTKSWFRIAGSRAAEEDHSDCSHEVWDRHRGRHSSCTCWQWGM